MQVLSVPTLDGLCCMSSGQLINCFVMQVLSIAALDGLCCMLSCEGANRLFVKMAPISFLDGIGSMVFGELLDDLLMSMFCIKPLPCRTLDTFSTPSSHQIVEPATLQASFKTLSAEEAQHAKAVPVSSPSALNDPHFVKHGDACHLALSDPVLQSVLAPLALDRGLVCILSVCCLDDLCSVHAPKTICISQPLAVVQIL
mmetsp:Transcript_11510/g.15015  ORF Transcript_11510/g.15015 Transcript_11510/m.15015 type:complete len:200 (-) Transcript_11510:1852-2451(-)